MVVDYYYHFEIVRIGCHVGGRREMELQVCHEIDPPEVDVAGLFVVFAIVGWP